MKKNVNRKMGRLQIKLIFIITFIFAEMVSAKIGTRMRKAKSAVVALPAALLSWNPSNSSDDFMTVSPQTFTLTNSGSVAATNLAFSVPIVTDTGSYISGTNTFIITGLTCGTTLAAGASCTVDVEWFNCNHQCIMAIPLVCNGIVQAMADAGATANISPLYFNCGGL